MSAPLTDSAEVILEQTPAFNLLIVAATSSTAALVPTIVEGVFGVKNLRLDELKPIRLPSNERIILHFACSSASTAREYIQSKQGPNPAEAIHAVWYLFDEGERKAISVQDLALGVETLIVVPAKRQIDLRTAGISNDIVAVDVTKQPSLAELSKRTELLFTVQPGKRLVWVAAQRVSNDEKIEACISKGMRLFTVAVGASAQPIPFVGGATGVGVMALLQRDLVKIYNFEDPSNILLSKSLGNIFYEVATGLPVKWMTSLVGLSTISGLWEAPSSARNITQAIADLVLVLDAILYTIHHKGPCSTAVTPEEVKAIIKLYEKGSGKRSKVGTEFSRNAVHEKLGTKRIGRFDVWKSLKRKEAEQALRDTIAAHRYREM